MLPAGAQVTRLSNNTSYGQGFPLTDTKILLRSGINDSIWVYDIPGNTFTKLSDTITVGANFAFGLLNGVLYFSGKTATSGIELCKTDGTPAGTSMVRDINAGAANSDPKYGFIAYNNELYFTANDGTTGRELWKTDGTSGGTVQVKNINPGAADAFITTLGLGDKIPAFGVVGGFLVFSAITAADGDELWATDGTGPGTTEIKNINTTPGVGSHISNFTVYGSDLIFTAFDAVSGDQLWKTNGTALGTLFVADVNPNPPALPPPFLYLFPDITPVFFNFQNTLYFTANDGTNGAELWKTDGSGAGTGLVKDINPGAANGFPAGLPSMALAVKNSSKFFFTATGTEGSELWQSDGTGPGTTILIDIAGGATGSDPLILPDFFGNGSLFQGNKFFFIANTPGVEGNEFYVSDGTPGGTSLLKDINPGPANGFDGTNLSWFYAGNKFYFVADDGINGAELWQSDGVGLGTGTILAADVNPNPGEGSAISDMFVASNTLFFFGTDGDDPVKTDFFKLDAPVSLPLRWVSFEARPSNDDVLLLWETAVEEQTDYFVVQRSANGSDYYDLGRVNANGIGSNHYTFTDAAAMKKTGIKKWYYRIKYVDKDGKSALSKTATVTLNKLIASILILPNPVVNELKLVIEATSNDQAVISVMNIEGKTVLQRSIPIHRGENTVIEDVGGLTNGVYLLHIVTGGSSSAERFLIQR